MDNMLEGNFNVILIQRGGEVRATYRLQFGCSKKKETPNVTSHSSEFKKIQMIASNSGNSKERFGAVRYGAENRERACGTRS